MSITTRRGDGGETDLLGGRVPKDHALIELVGTLDELNAQLGVARTLAPEAPLGAVQEALFVLGAQAAAAGGPVPATLPQLRAEDLAALDAACSHLEAELQPLRAFVLPGGSPAGSALHLARAVARRAERRLITAVGAYPGLGDGVPYLNRLSDLLFLMARQANLQSGADETTWKGTA